MSQLDCRIRPLEGADLSWVLPIEEALFPAPWGSVQFLDSLQAGYECWVAEVAGQGVGYALLSVAGGEADLQNIAVASSHQRIGVAARLLDQVLRRAGVRGAEQVFLEVRASNLGALAFYRQQGFSEVGRRRNYYPTGAGREDALIFRRDLQGSAGSPCQPS